MGSQQPITADNYQELLFNDQHDLWQLEIFAMTGNYCAAFIVVTGYQMKNYFLRCQ